MVTGATTASTASEWRQITRTHPTVVIRCPHGVPWKRVHVVHWLCGGAPDDREGALSIIKRGHQLGGHSVTCKIFAVRVGKGGVDNSQCDVACIVEKVDGTWAEHFNRRRASSAAEYGLIRAVSRLIKTGHWHSSLVGRNIGILGMGKGVDIKLLSIRKIQHVRCTDERLMTIVQLYPMSRRQNPPGGGAIGAHVSAAMRGDGIFHVDRNVYRNMSAGVSVHVNGQPKSPVYAWCGDTDSSRIRRDGSHGSTAAWRMIDFSDTITYPVGLEGMVTWGSRYGKSGIARASVSAQQSFVELLEALTDMGHVMLPLGPANVVFVSPNRPNERILFLDIHGMGLTRMHNRHGGDSTSVQKNKEASVAAHLMVLTCNETHAPVACGPMMRRLRRAQQHL
jgi:hypothetical protein